jgi:DNA-binding NarL/FixJ family response regulator
VALLIADGLANRVIAERLAVSERTVETHVRNVLTKLGLANRTQVAAWTLRAGLST